MSPERPIISFIVPALNEELNLPPLFERLLGLEQRLNWPSEICVVDDCSRDGTLRVAQEWQARHPQIRPIHKPMPHGLGRGICTALQHVQGKVGIVVMADGVDPLEEAVPEFCKLVLDEGCQLVLLSRYLDPRDSQTIPLSYKVHHTIFRFCTAFLLGIPFRDTTYAFRAFDIPFVRGLNLHSGGFEISPEITFKTHFSGGKIGQVRGRQTRRVHGKSNFLFSRAARGYSKVLAEGFYLRLTRQQGPGNTRSPRP